MREGNESHKATLQISELASRIQKSKITVFGDPNSFATREQASF